MRFHCGISFSWKTIKKFLFPILVGLLAYFGFNGFSFGFISAYAYTNSDTSWNLTMPNYDEVLRSVNCGNNGTMYDIVNDFIENTSTTYYNLFINVTLDSSNNFERVTFYIKWNENQTLDYNRITTWAQRINPNWVVEYQATYSANGNDRVPFYTMTSSSCSNYQSSSDYLMFKNLTDTGDYSNASSVGAFDYQNFKAPNFSNDFNTFSTINNTSSYDITKWFYYSTVTHIYHYSNTIGNAGYNKNLCITDNNTCYGNNDEVPSYYDLHHIEEPTTESFIDYKDNLGTLYANFLPSQINNFNIQMSFNVPSDMTSFEYRQNTTFVSNCFARVNNNDNYYSYVSLPCSFEMDNTFDSSSLGIYKFLNFEFYDSNNNVITDFSNYDKLFVYIDFSYFDDSLPKYISNLSITSNGNTLYQDYFSGTIFDNFDNLPTLFKMFISSNNTSDYSYVKVRSKNSSLTDNYYFLYLQQYNTSNLNPIGNTQIIGRESFRNFQVSNTNNIGYMIFQQQNNQNNLASPNNLELVFSNNIIISINNLSNNNFYYYDDTTISNNTIVPTYDNPASNNYDLSEFFSIVNNYIEDASDKVIQFHNLVQDFYDSMPLYLQSTIYVLFILFCSYILYREIRR